MRVFLLDNRYTRGDILVRLPADMLMFKKESALLQDENYTCQALPE